MGVLRASLACPPQFLVQSRIWLVVGVVLAVGMGTGLGPRSAHAQEQTKSQQKCTDTMNNGSLKTTKEGG